MPGSNMDDGSDSLDFVEHALARDPVALEQYVCQRCGVYKPREDVTFNKRDAVMHLITFHPHKLADGLANNPLLTLEIAFLLEDHDRFKGGV